jgi:hypothetical protein
MVVPITSFEENWLLELALHGPVNVPEAIRVRLRETGYAERAALQTCVSPSGWTRLIETLCDACELDEVSASVRPQCPY